MSVTYQERMTGHGRDLETDAAAADAIPGAGEGDRLQGPRVPLRELMGDQLLDTLAERSRDEAGGLRLTGEDRCWASWSGRCWSGRWRPS